MVVQETKANKNQIEEGKQYTWYFSGENKVDGKTEEPSLPTGVGIVMNSKYKNYVFMGSHTPTG